MASFVGPQTLAPVGTTGNNTHTGIDIPANVDKIIALFKVEVAGATPTVTAKFQGSMDGTDWFDLFCLPSDSDTGAITFVKTAVGVTGIFPSQAQSRFSFKIRLVTSANTNVTYSSTAWFEDDN